MYFKQFYLGCLAHASYLIGSDGEALVVDPQRDVHQYVEEAKKQNLKIKYVLETHLHADFVSGHIELAKLTGAEIVISKKAEAKFQHKAVEDNEKLVVGNLEITVLETPGHTPESVCFLVSEKSDSNDTKNPKSPDKLLTGDTLFIGDVGRPDLVGAKGYSQEEMAAQLYDSIFNKLLVLDDDTEVYPAHGAGSLCGKNLSTERSSTIGIQKKFNCALKVTSKDEFISQLCDNLPEIPQYFPVAVKLNKEGAVSLDELPTPKELSASEVKTMAESGTKIVDTRPPALYGAGHIPGSLNISLGGQFASWTGTLIPVEEEIILLAENKEAVSEAVVRLARSGHEKVAGFLAGGIAAWEKSGLPLVQVKQITVQELKDLLSKQEDLQVVDVRRPGEYEAAHVPTAVNIPLSELEKNVGDIAPERPTAVVCRSGYRSSIGTGILAKAGVKLIYNVTGGTTAWIDTGYDTTREESEAGVSSCNMN